MMAHNVFDKSKFQTSGTVSSGKNSKDALKKLKQELKDSQNALDDMELAKIKQEKSVQVKFVELNVL